MHYQTLILIQTIVLLFYSLPFSSLYFLQSRYTPVNFKMLILANIDQLNFFANCKFLLFDEY